MNELVVYVVTFWWMVWLPVYLFGFQKKDDECQKWIKYLVYYDGGGTSMHLILAY